MPRKPKIELTPEISRTITEQIKVGNFRKHAAQAAGITESCFQTWMRWGTGGAGSETLTVEDRERYEKFADDVATAEAQAICNSLLYIQAAASAGDWRAAAWFMARKARHEWGDPAKAGIKEQLELLLKVIEDVLGKQDARRVLQEFVARSGQEAA